MQSHYIDELLNPRSLAIVGASNNAAKWGGWLMSSVIEAGFPGKIIPINSKDEVVLERKAYRNILEVPYDVDIISACIAADHVPEIIRAAHKKPIVLMKPGITDAGKTAAASHTGSIAGNDTNLNLPEPLVTAVLVPILEEPLTTTVTPGKASPLGSLTVPLMAPTCV